MNTDREQVMDILQAGINGTLDISEVGICENLDMNRGIDGYKIVKELSESWDKHSNDEDYPVPAPDHYVGDPNRSGSSAEQCFYGSDFRWEGSYGDLRKELCVHLFEQLSNMSEQEFNERFTYTY